MPALFLLFAVGVLTPETTDASDTLAVDEERPTTTTLRSWEFGAFVDTAYSLDFNFPPNHTFRSRSTTPRVNELDLNMTGISVRKDPEVSSPWGAELLAQAGEDSKEFGFGVNEPKVASSDQLRHFGRANISYLTPGSGNLLIQAGLFNSFIGYESLYAKDNANYTRAWVSEYSPYLMFGVNATYKISPHLTGAVFVINGYWHLSHPNDLPSYGAQVAWKGASRFSLRQTIYYGPDQSDTSIKYWRFFSDSIATWQEGPVTIGLDYQIGTEIVAGLSGSPRTFWTGASLPIQWHVAGPWSAAVRPEFYWDPNGRLTGSEQLIKTVSVTLEHRSSVRFGEAILRLEYRFDESTGPQGGFFTKIEGSGNTVGLTPAQQVLIFSAIWTFSIHP